MSAVTEQQVLAVDHLGESLFRFTTTRDPGFRFRSGHFVMLGLEVAGRPLLRAYSVASGHYEEHLEFYSVKVPGGPLTSHLAGIRPGDRVLVGRKPTGTLVLDHLAPGRRLLLLSTGTGLAPFLSVVRDPETYARFDRVIVAHGVRTARELGYRELLEQRLASHELVGDVAPERLRYFPTVTREPFARRGRLTDHLRTGALPGELGESPLDPSLDRVMVCGSPAMLDDTVALLEARGFTEGSSHAAGSYVIERAFAARN